MFFRTQFSGSAKESGEENSHVDKVERAGIRSIAQMVEEQRRAGEKLLLYRQAHYPGPDTGEVPVLRRFDTEMDVIDAQRGLVDKMAAANAARDAARKEAAEKKALLDEADRKAGEAARKASEAKE